MTDLQALLKAVLDSPDDDTPRLVYADELQASGQDERAEFIRVQIEDHWLGRRLAKDGLPVGLRNRKAKELFERSLGLERQYTQKWFPFPFDFIYFERGFVEIITGTAANWLAHCDAIMAGHPVRKVKLTTLPEVSRHPFFEESRHLKATDIIEVNLGARNYKKECLRNSLDGEWNYSVADVIEHGLKEFWPNIEFEFPSYRGLSDFGRSDTLDALQMALAVGVISRQTAMDQLGMI